MQQNDISCSAGRKIFNDFLTEHGKARLSDKFDALTELYFDVCRKINISAIKTVDDVYIKHYLDSVYPYDLFFGEVCDVGCGGGFPTIPLAIVTGLHVTGIDGVGKKLSLISAAAEKLKLNVSAEHIRAEELKKRSVRFDTVCARAVSDVDKTLRYCAPLAKRDGKVILYRTQNDAPATPDTLKSYGITLIETTDYLLPETDVKRRLMVYKKL